MTSLGGKPRSQAGTWPSRATPRPDVRTHDSPSGTYFLTQLRSWVGAEAGPGRLLPWLPVGFGAGIAIYFAAEREPVAWVAAVTALVLAGAAVLLRQWRWFSLLAMVAAMAAGFAIAALKTARAAHEVLARPMFSAALKGFVETREERERTDRFVLRVVEMDSPRSEVRLTRVRLSVKKGAAPPVGSFVVLKARLLPPMSPVAPGSYDFGRDMYFAGIGASGFVMGAVTVRVPPADGGWQLRYAATMQGMRDAIDARIRQVLEGDHRAIATALLTGRRDAISRPVNDAMFISGLGHVLSISGYHMAVVAGVVFFAVRALLALSRRLTVAAPIKKWSAAAALAAAAFYLLLSGAEVATQRSFFMTAVVLIAVMVDRRAVTFRTLAIAAMIVLAVTPEALVHPSFQMSFAATLGLVALVQIGMPGLLASADHSRTARAALWGGREIAMLALASLIAGLATTPYAAFHFHRITPYGVIANLLAMPVISAVVMPAGLLGLAAIPFGFDGVFWQLMGAGISWMISVSNWVAALPGAIGRIAAFGIGPLVLATAGIIVLGLLRTPLRWSGAIILALGIAWAQATPRPDVLIAGEGSSVAVRGADGRLHLMQRGKDQFLLRQWLAADADIRLPGDASLTEGVACDDAGCVAQLASGGLVALALHPAALGDDCARAVLVVTALDVPADCQAHVIDHKTMQKSGAAALRQTGGGFVTTSVRSKSGDRPWSPAVPDAPEAGNRPGRPTVAPQRDATPAQTDLQPDDL